MSILREPWPGCFFDREGENATARDQSLRPASVKGRSRASWGSPESAFPSTGRGKKPSRAFPESPAIAFSSTGRRKRQSQGTQMTPNRLLLGLMVRGLKLPFPRQAGGKGHREHARRAPKLHFPRQAEGNGHREGPKRRPASTDESPFWRP